MGSTMAESKNKDSSQSSLNLASSSSLRVKKTLIPSIVWFTSMESTGGGR